jgi:lipopolysaccharide/colanic/teichoic acid biosynthesis glycosyltransferase
MGRRLFDLVVAVPLAVLLAPLFAGVALAILLTMGRPVLFTQTRPGLNARPFLIYKFRTMRELRGADGRPLPDAERLTALGRALRATSLDELPEILNVIRGEMSLIGPRPLLMEYLPLYNAEQARRHEIKPGITGWAQVNGRNAIDWPEKFRLDVWYVDNRSALLDARILLLTLWRVIRRQGINQAGSATMEPFRGNFQA